MENVALWRGDDSNGNCTVVGFHDALVFVENTKGCFGLHVVDVGETVMVRVVANGRHNECKDLKLGENLLVVRTDNFVHDELSHVNSVSPVVVWYFVV